MTKFPWWDDPNDKIEILDATVDAQKKYGHLFGSDTIKLDVEHILALLDGKMLAWDDTEYSTFVVCEGTRVDMLSALHHKLKEEASEKDIHPIGYIALATETEEPCDHTGTVRRLGGRCDWCGEVIE